MTIIYKQSLEVIKTMNQLSNAFYRVYIIKVIVNLLQVLFDLILKKHICIFLNTPKIFKSLKVNLIMSFK